jgi:ribosomal protein S18 acetylase RimI-like enzyme
MVLSYSSSVKIETLPERLYDDAVALWHDTGLTRPWNDPSADLHRAVEGASSTVLAAIDGETLVATAMVGHDGHRGWVYYLAVSPELQGQGLGRRMMTECQDWVLARGIPKLQLMVRSSNAAAMGFYQRIGYIDAEVVVLGRRLDTTVGNVG